MRPATSPYADLLAQVPVRAHTGMIDGVDTAWWDYGPADRPVDLVMVHGFRGDHHGQALVKGETAGRDLAGRQIGKWLRERFPAISETGSGV